MFVCYKCYILKELIFPKELMLIKQANWKSAIFFFIGIFQISFRFQTNVCSRSHDLLMISIHLSDITISSIKIGDYRCIISRISKNEAINLMQNTDLTEKNGTLLSMKTYDYV